MFLFFSRRAGGARACVLLFLPSRSTTKGGDLCARKQRTDTTGENKQNSNALELERTLRIRNDGFTCEKQFRVCLLAFFFFFFFCVLSSVHNDGKREEGGETTSVCVRRWMSIDEDETRTKKREKFVGFFISEVSLTRCFCRLKNVFLSSNE